MSERKTNQAHAFENLMIQASAGSGKTHDLVGRYLRLLDAFEKPQAIVALTFTRKAAGEFFDRILSALAEAASDESAAAKAAKDYAIDTLTRDRALQLLRLLADHLHELSLGTLDGFYARVLRAFPAEFGVTADYEVLDETAAQAARREVLDGVLEQAREDSGAAFLEAFRRATFGSEERSVERSLEDYVKRFHRRYLSAPDSAAWGEPAQIWPNGAWWLAAPKPSELEAAVDVLDAAAAGFLAEAKPKKNCTKALNSVIKAAKSAQPGFVGDPATFVASVLKSLDGLRDGSVDELIYSRSKVPLSQEVQPALVTAGHWILWCELTAKLEQTAGVREIVRRYEQRYDRKVRRAGNLSFDDVLAVLAGVAPVREPGSDEADGGHFLLSMDRGAETSAEDREALRLLVDYRLDARFQHWLIDEFQDTSRRQWQVLRNLIDEVMFDDSGERSFYYVGDVKQAIFGWRGGDSRLFDEVRRRYENLPQGRRIELEKLDHSWRSGPVILEMVNRVFGDAAVLAQLIGEEHRAVIDERWAKTWGDHQSNVSEQPGYARWVTVPKPPGERSVPKDLRWKTVLATLHELRLDESKLSCAVLVRKGQSAHDLADYVRQHSDIPVMVEGRMAVGADHPVGTSFAALLQWAAHPGDTRCRAHLRMTPPHAKLSTSEALAWERDIPPLVLRLIHDGGFGGVFEWWCLLLRNAVAGRDRLGEFSEHRIEQIAEACRHFDDSGQRDIDEFLKFLEGYEAADLPAPGTVQLMTVHKAKGLTFDAVIVADIEGDSITSAGQLHALNKSNDEGTPEWILMRPKKDLALAVDPLDAAYRQAEMDAAFEELCVLYVALTRARFANYVISGPPSSSKGNCAPPMLLQATLADAEPTVVDVDGLDVDRRYQHGDPQWLEKLELPGPPETAPAQPRPEVTGRRRFPPRRRRLPSGTADGRPFGDPQLWFGAQNARATGFGSAVHALFECIAWLDELSAEAREPCWQAALAGYEEFAVEARAEVERSLDNPEIAALFTRPPDAGVQAEVWQEKRFEMIIEGDQWVSGVIDRVNLFADRAQIIDFKTNRVDSDESIAKAVAHYRPQMETYRVALSRLTGLAPESIECLLIFTRPGRIESIAPAESGGVEELGETPAEGEVTQGEFEL